MRFRCSWRFGRAGRRVYRDRLIQNEFERAQDLLILMQYEVDPANETAALLLAQLTDALPIWFLSSLTRSRSRCMGHRRGPLFNALDLRRQLPFP